MTGWFEGGRYLARCDHAGCTAWGAYGFGVSFRRHAEAVEAKRPDAGRWLGLHACAAHRAEIEEKAMGRAPVVPTADGRGQGRLL